MREEESLLPNFIIISGIIAILIAIIGVVFYINNVNIDLVIEFLVINIDIVAIFISGSLVVVTFVYTITTKKNLNHQILVNLREEYGSAEMMYAIQRLWVFYQDECNKDEDTMKKIYEKKSREQKQHFMKNGNYDVKIKRISNSLSYQRRLVANFYYHLADLHTLNMIPDDILFSIWGSSDLKILKNIIIPLEEMQELISLYDEEKEGKIKDKIEKLETLYKDSVDYEKIK